MTVENEKNTQIFFCYENFLMCRQLQTLYYLLTLAIAEKFCTGRITNMSSPFLHPIGEGLANFHLIYFTSLHIVTV